MEFKRECQCLKDELLLNVSEDVITKEILEEIDPDELVEDESEPDNVTWQNITAKFYNDRKLVEEYKKLNLKECQAESNITVEFLDKNVFSLLIGILETTLNQAISFESLIHQKTVFNGIDFIAELLYNWNPLYPQRRNNWQYIFDMDWVIKFLKERPRLYYPLSWIWSKEYAASKIQAYFRGYRVRTRNDVQEMRQFWKVIKENKCEDT